MFKYISEILSQFTRTQRIVALLMLLTSIIIITIAPSFISSITMDRKELETKISKQNARINSLETLVDTLDRKIRDNQSQCTEELFVRESEFIQMLDDIKSEAYKFRSVKKPIRTIKRIPSNYDDSSGVVMMESRMSIAEPEPQADISPMIKKIDKMKKSIRKN